LGKVPACAAFQLSLEKRSFLPFGRQVTRPYMGVRACFGLRSPYTGVLDMLFTTLLSEKTKRNNEFILDFRLMMED
jgi:hypothetical protein